VCDGDGKAITAFCEFKRRHVQMDKYPTLILSLRKYKQLVSYSWCEDGAYLFVRWNDKDGVHRIPSKAIEYDIEWGGRIDRGDWQDNEPVVHIPISDFGVLPLERERLASSGREKLMRLLDRKLPWTVGPRGSR